MNSYSNFNWDVDTWNNIEEDIDLVSVSILKNKLNSHNRIISDNAPKKLVKDLFLMLNDNSIKIKPH